MLDGNFQPISINTFLELKICAELLRGPLFSGSVNFLVKKVLRNRSKGIYCLLNYVISFFRNSIDGFSSFDYGETLANKFSPR